MIEYCNHTPAKLCQNCKDENAAKLSNSAVMPGYGAWVSAEARMPGYYVPVWAFDGTQVFLAKLVGRSYTPQRKIWRDLEHNNVEGFSVVAWMPCVKPEAP